MVVQHNMQAANANRMLNVTTSAQSKSTEKLSSGYKINRAADDAAGLTISEKMRKQIKGLDRASTNAEDGVSSVQTAEGALTEVHSMLQRMNELATQAANGTNSKDSDRQAIQDEIDQLTTEIDRVSETTKFNETYLLKGDAGTKTINMKAHDAGLKGTLTDNGDGTATFVMDTLNAGDKVSIGGKNYTIGGETADVTSMLTAAGITDKAGDKVTINGKEYTYFDKASDGKTELNNKGYYETAPDKADVATASPTYADSTAIGAATGTISVGTKSVTKMKDAGADGIDDTDTTVISKKKHTNSHQRNYLRLIRLVIPKEMLK